MAKRGKTGPQPNKHFWRLDHDVVAPSGQLRSVFVCKLCGVDVDTSGPFPAIRFSEIWDGQRIAAGHPRPACTAWVDGALRQGGREWTMTR